MTRRALLLAVLAAVGAVLWLAHDAWFDGLVGAAGGRHEGGADLEVGEGEGAAAGAARGGPALLGSGSLRPGAQGPAADEAAARAQAAARARAALAGQVEFAGLLKDAGGVPVAEARVVVAGDLGGSTVIASASDGTFRTSLRPGRYDVLVIAPGRGTLHLADYVIDGVARLDLELKLTPPSQVTLVVERAGRGVEGAQVSARLARWRWEGESPSVEGVTDASGRATLADLVAGTYALEARIPDGPLLRQSLEVERDLELRLTVPDAVELFGLVSDAATQQPVPGASVRVVTAAPKGPSLEVSGVTGPDGVYRLRVPKGAAQVFAVTAGGYAPWPHAREVGKVLGSLKGLGGGSQPVERNVPLTAGGSVVGRVTQKETQAPLPGITLLFRPRRGEPVRATTAEEGRYAVPNLNPGEYEVAVDTSGWYPEQALRVRVPPGATEPVTFDLVLQGARSISGSVVLAEGAPVAGARVWLTGGGKVVMSALASGRPLETFTSTDGRFQLTDVPPALYVLVRAAVGDLEATPVGVPPDRPPPEPLRLVLASTVVLSGRVLELGSNEPLAGAGVTLRPKGAPVGRDVRTATSDAEGRFRFDTLIPGECEVLAQRADHLPMAPLLVPLSGRDEQRVELLLDPGLVIAGVLVGPQGQALAGSVRVSGTVGETGQGVSRAQAVGPDGRFRLTGFRRGAYRLRADAPGHRPQTVPDLLGGEERLRVELPLIPLPPN